MRNYIFILLVFVSIFSCKKSDKPLIDNSPESKITYTADSTSTQPGLFFTLKASSKIVRDTLTTNLGGKSVLIFKIDSLHYAFWVPVIPAGTYPLDLRGLNSGNRPEVVIRNYDAIINPDAVISEVITDYKRLADSLEINSFFNKNATRHASFIRQLLQQINENLGKVTSQEKQLLAYHFKFNKADFTLFQQQMIDTTYLVSRVENTTLDVGQQAVDKLTQFEAKKIEAIIEGKKALIIYAAMYFALPNPLLLGALSVGAAIQTAHFLYLMDEASELCTQPMTTAFQAFDGMKDENGNGTVGNAILANNSIPIEFRYIAKFKTLQKSDESSLIQIIAIAIKAAYELEENGQSIKTTFDEVKNKFSALFDKINVSFSPFVSPVLTKAKEKLARINSRFISITNVSNPNIIATAVDDGNNGLKLTFSNPANNITTETDFSFQVSYTQAAINNTVNVTNYAKFKPLAFPSITTALVGSITASSAYSGGIITNDGGATVSAKGVCYSTLPNPTITDQIVPHGTAAGTFVSSITGLSPNTIYYVKAYATNSVGTSYGSEITFKTLQLTKPVLTTSSTTSITQTTAVSGGNVTNDGGSAVTSRGVCWSTFPGPTIADERTFNGAGVGSFVSNLSNLVANKRYYMRAYASNSVGTAYGNEVSFITMQLGGLDNTSWVGYYTQTNDGNPPGTRFYVKLILNVNNNGLITGNWYNAIPVTNSNPTNYTGIIWAYSGSTNSTNTQITWTGSNVSIGAFTFPDGPWTISGNSLTGMSTYKSPAFNVSQVATYVLTKQ